MLFFISCLIHRTEYKVQSYDYFYLKDQEYNSNGKRFLIGRSMNMYFSYDRDKWI